MEKDTVDADTISKVMRMIGSKKTPKKTEQAAANLAAGRKRLQDPDVRALLSEKQQARRERERQEREAAGVIVPDAPKAKRGRPRKVQEGTTTP